MKKDCQNSTIWFDKEARKVGNENGGWFHYLLNITKDCVTVVKTQ